jgi:hypothetical protein
MASSTVLPLASEMEEPMRKTKMQKRPKSTDTLLKTSKKKDIELTNHGFSSGLFLITFVLSTVPHQA